jgi:hypothetical protein
MSVAALGELASAMIVLKAPGGAANVATSSPVIISTGCPLPKADRVAAQHSSMRVSGDLLSR